MSRDGSSAVRLEVSGPVATLTMDQQEKRNALTPELLNGLGDGLERCSADPEVRVIVLTNSGPAFCAGADLSGSPSTEEPRFDLVQILTTIQDSPKPVVARIAGHCMGGGVGLAAACDLSIAVDSVNFGFTEVRIGVVPAIISVVCLPKLSRRDSLELFLTGERITAERAARVGLINAVVPHEHLAQAVDGLVAKLLAGAPGALAAAKRIVFDVPLMGRAAAFDEMADLSRNLFAGAEAAEGMASFRERRKPSWAP
jgi:methylglutaconyl-CoA hydratase